jgi:type I restriction enzyme R subunit
MDKKSMSERDICTKFITPAIAQAGWDIQKQVREEFCFTKSRIMVRGKLHTRGNPPRPTGDTRLRA